MCAVIKKLAYAVFPNRCFFCGQVIEPRASFCADCTTDLGHIKGELCEICGRPPGECICFYRSFDFERCATPFNYTGIVRRGLNILKEERSQRAADFFAFEMSEWVYHEFSGVEFSAVTYVPVTINTSIFNQAKMLAVTMAHLLRLECLPPPIIKIPSCLPQHSLDIYGRWKNVKNGYLPGKGSVQGNLLLVDDVITTGATMSRCAQLICEAGAEAVYSVAAAAASTGGKSIPIILNTD